MRTKFFVSQYRKISFGNTLMYRKVSGIEKFYKSERGVSRFSIENFCHTVPKKFVAERFGVSENFVHRKILCIRRGHHLTPLKNFSHTADKISRRTLLCFERILVSKIFKHRRGEVSRFCRNIFQLTGPKKIRQGTILFQKISGREKFL